jgi:signal transduction histidine kinase
MPYQTRTRRSPGLLSKLTWFFLAISLPALLLVELVVVVYEYSGLTRRIEAGLLRDAVQAEAQALAPILVEEHRATLRHALDAWVLQLERPRSILGDQTSYVLLELAAQPFSVAVIDRDGGKVAVAPSDRALWELDIAEFAREVEADLPSQELRRVASDAFNRRYAAPLWFKRELRGWLLLEIRLNKPWRKLAADVSFEWPVILASLLLIALGAALFLHWTVTRRLQRIEAASNNWARGEFARLIADPSGDEIGALSAELDRMALSLRELLHTRGALARMAERERLARDLHDTVKQQAFALHLKLAAVIKRMADGPIPIRSELEQARSLVHSMQTELAQILVGLKTESGPKLPLTERLRAQLEAWSQISAIPARLRAMAEVDLPPLQQEELLRLVDQACARAAS